MSDRENLLRNVQIADFALVEAGLYLDTHPTDQNALEYYRSYQKELEKATAAYQAAYGPLTARANEGSRWKWVDGPAPWERAANV